MFTRVLTFSAVLALAGSSPAQTKTVTLNSVDIMVNGRSVALGTIVASLRVQSARRDFAARLFLDAEDEHLIEWADLHWLQIVETDTCPSQSRQTYFGKLPPFPIVDPPKGGWDYMYLDGKTRKQPDPKFDDGRDDEPWYNSASGEAKQFVRGESYGIGDAPGFKCGTRRFQTWLVAKTAKSELCLIRGVQWSVSPTTNTGPVDLGAPTAAHARTIATALGNGGFTSWKVQPSCTLSVGSLRSIRTATNSVSLVELDPITGAAKVIRSHSVPVFASTTRVAFDSAGRRAFAQLATGELWTLDLHTGNLLSRAKPPLPLAIAALAFDPVGRNLYALYSLGQNAALVRMTTGGAIVQVLGIYPVSPTLGQGTIDAGGRRFLFSTYGPIYRLLAVDLRTGNIQSIATLPWLPVGLEYDSVTDGVFTTNWPNVVRIDSRTGRTTHVGSYPSQYKDDESSAFDPDGRRHFAVGFLGQQNVLLSMDVTTGKVLAQPPIPQVRDELTWDLGRRPTAFALDTCQRAGPVLTSRMLQIADPTTISISKGPANGSFCVVLSLAPPSQLQIAGCTWYPGPIWIATLCGKADAAGAASLTYRVPPFQFLHGWEIVMQGFFGLSSITNGVFARIGK